MQEPVRRANGLAEGVAHNDVADGAANAEKVHEVALRAPASSPVLAGWAATAGEGAEDAPLAEELLGVLDETHERLREGELTEAC